MSTSVLRDIFPYLPLELIPPAKALKIEQFASTLPPPSNVLFECRLMGKKDAIDLSFRYRRFSSANIIRYADRIGRSASWDRIRSFCMDWENLSSFLHEEIENIWLEFDQEAYDAPIPIPNLFIGFKDGSLSNFDENCLRKMETLVNSLFPGIRPPSIRNLLHLLPTGATLEHIGVMYPREATPLRLCFNIPVIQVNNFLLKIYGIKFTSITRQLIDEIISNYVDVVMVQVNADDEDAGVIGLDVRSGPGFEMVDFIKQLAAKERFPQIKVDSMFKWEGQSSELFYEETNPKVMHAPPRNEENYSRVNSRNISHIKFNCSANQILEIKAYLGAGFWYLHECDEPGMFFNPKYWEIDTLSLEKTTPVNDFLKLLMVDKNLLQKILRLGEGNWRAVTRLARKNGFHFAEEDILAAIPDNFYQLAREQSFLGWANSKP